MRGNPGIFIGLLAVVFATTSGCQTSGSKRPATVISPSATVSDAGDPDASVAEKSIAGAPVRTANFTDRHPLFTKPRQYFESSGENKVVKVAAATFIGVPAGFVGEVKQIFVGVPPEARY